MAKKKNDNGEQTTEKPTRKPRQGHLPTMEPEIIPEVEAAAEAYVQARDARMRLGETEVERREMLRGLMKQHKLKVYEFDGRTVEIVPGDEKVKVRTKKEGDDEPAEE